MGTALNDLVAGLAIAALFMLCAVALAREVRAAPLPLPHQMCVWIDGTYIDCTVVVETGRPEAVLRVIERPLFADSFE